MKNIIWIFIAIVISCNNVKQTRTVIKEDSNSKQIIEEKLINNEVVENCKKIWEYEYIEAIGQIPVLKKYDDDVRNIALARRGAILDAQREIARKITSTSITETVVLSDLESSDYVQSYLNTKIQNLEIVDEFYDEDKRTYRVKVRMPKESLIIILEQYID